MTVRKRLLGPALLLTLIATALVAACGGGDATPTTRPTSTTPPTATAASMSPTPTAAPTATSVPKVPAPGPTATLPATMELDVSAVLIALDELNDSGQSGWAKLAAKGDDTEIILSLSPGVMVSSLVHVHSGQCGDSLGGVANGLTNIVDGMSTTLLEGVSLDSLLTGDFAINAHNADDASVYTACGNIPTSESLTVGGIQPTTVQLIAVSELNDSGQSGWAKLAAKGNDTEVIVSLSPGAMVSNLVHIHSGQCGDSLGGVANGLSNFVDGMSVTLLEGVSLDSLLAGDFAVNAHNADDPGVYTACGNISGSASQTTEPAPTATEAPTATAPVPTPQTGDTTSPIQATIQGFILPDLNITVDPTVTWTQRDNTPHTTTSGINGLFDDVGWDSDILGENETFSHTFNEEGTFPYTCLLHPYMSDTVTVAGDGDTSTSDDTPVVDDTLSDDDYY